MQDADKYITPELREAVRRFGFHKVAAKMYGVEEINDKVATQIIGTNLMARLGEWKKVATGLDALKQLEE